MPAKLGWQQVAEPVNLDGVLADRTWSETEVGPALDDSRLDDGAQRI